MESFPETRGLGFDVQDFNVRSIPVDDMLKERNTLRPQAVLHFVNVPSIQAGSKLGAA